MPDTKDTTDTAVTHQYEVDITMTILSGFVEGPAAAAVSVINELGLDESKITSVISIKV